MFLKIWKNQFNELEKPQKIWLILLYFIPLLKILKFNKIKIKLSPLNF